MLQSVSRSQTTTSVINQSAGLAQIPTTLNIGDNDYVILADRSGYQIMKATAAASGGAVSVE